MSTKVKRRPPDTRILRKPHYLRWGSHRFKIVAARKVTRFDLDQVSFDDDEYINGRLEEFGGLYQITDIWHFVFLSPKHCFNVIAPKIGSIKRPPSAIISSKSKPTKDAHATIVLGQRKILANVWVENLSDEDLQLVRSIQSPRKRAGPVVTVVSDDYTKISWGKKSVKIPRNSKQPRRFLQYLLFYLHKENVKIFNYHDVCDSHNKDRSMKNVLSTKPIYIPNFCSDMFKNLKDEWRQLFAEVEGSRGEYRFIPPIPTHLPHKIPI